jgi:hypothetical protein
MPSVTRDQVGLAEDAFDWQTKAVANLDDKAGRLITGIAFFLTAITALLANADVRNAAFLGPNKKVVHLPLILLVLFLVFGAFAALQLILAIGAVSKPPRSELLGEPSAASFVAISEDAPAAWEKLFTMDDPRLRDYRFRVLKHEAPKAAQMAAYKNGRIIEARALLFFAVACLAMVLPLVVETVSSSSRSPVVWTFTRSVPTALGIAAVTFIAANDRHRVEADVDSLLAVGSPRDVFRDMAPSMALFAALTALASTGELAWVILALPALLPSVWSLFRWRNRPNRELSFLYSLPSPALVALYLPTLVIFLVPSARMFELVAAFTPLVLFEGVRLADPVLGRLQHAAGFDRYLSRSGTIGRRLRMSSKAPTTSTDESE